MASLAINRLRVYLKVLNNVLKLIFIAVTNFAEKKQTFANFCN